MAEHFCHLHDVRIVQTLYQIPWKAPGHEAFLQQEEAIKDRSLIASVLGLVVPSRAGSFSERSGERHVERSLSLEEELNEVVRRMYQNARPQ